MESLCDGCLNVTICGNPQKFQILRKICDIPTPKSLAVLRLHQSFKLQIYYVVPDDKIGIGASKIDPELLGITFRCTIHHYNFPAVDLSDSLALTIARPDIDEEVFCLSSASPGGGCCRLNDRYIIFTPIDEFKPWQKIIDSITRDDFLLQLRR